MRTLLLALLYALVFVPTALVRRLVSGDPLERAWQPGAASYWRRA